MKTRPAKTMTAKDVLDTYFLETRARLIEVAANLDRIDRAPERATVAGDARLKFVAGALQILQSDAPDRAERIQRLYSKE